MRRRWKSLLIILCIPTVLVLSGYALYSYYFPFGYSHCCDKCLGMQLLVYAKDHRGWYPRGAGSPEASLGLMYPEYAGADLLRGKRIREAVARAILERSEALRPETCDWHYVEGLRIDDNPRLALFWDKAGLGHFGERMSEGGHTVCFVNGLTEHIPASRWEEFLKEQEGLLAELRERRQVNRE